MPGAGPAKQLRPRGSVADGFVQRRRLGKRGDTQFALQDGDARSVLTDGSGPVSREGKDPHQPAMGGLVEWVQVEAAPGRGDGAVDVALDLLGVRHAIEQLGNRSLQRDCPGRPPVVEVRAVAQRETGKEWAPNAISRGLQDRRFLNATHIRDRCRVDPDAMTLQGHDRAVDPQPASSECGPQHGQRPTEGPPGRRVIRLWPQECREFVARERSILDGQQGENRQRLARVDDDGFTVDPHLERTHDSDHEPGIGRHRRSGLDRHLP